MSAVAEFERVLAGHIELGSGFDEIGDYYPYVCKCGEYGGSPRWHRIHVAQALAAIDT